MGPDQLLDGPVVQPSAGDHGPLVEGGGLEVGVDGPGPLGRHDRVVPRLLEPLAVEVVQRQDLGLGVPAVPRGLPDGVGRPVVDGVPLAEREPVVGAVAEQDVPEGHPARTVTGEEVLQPGPRRVGRVREVPEHGAGELDRERLTQDGEAAQEEPVVPRQAVDPGGHHVVDGVRQLVHVLAAQGGRHQLTQEEGVPTQRATTASSWRPVNGAPPATSRASCWASARARGPSSTGGTCAPRGPRIPRRPAAGTPG